MNLYDPKASFEDETAGGEEPKSMSLMSGIAGGGGGDGPLGLEESPDEGRNILGQTTVLIAIVALIAAGSLYAMRLSQGNTAKDKDAEALEAKVDTWLVKAQTPGVGIESPMEGVNPGDVFTTDTTKYQVPIKFVKKNPFQFTFEDSVGDATNITSPNAAAHAREMRLKELQKELASLKVSSIMASNKRKVAVINNDLYQVGDHIGNFVVDDMNDMVVVMRNGTDKFELSIGTKDQAPRRSR